MDLSNWGGTFASDVASLARLATSGEFKEYLQEQIFNRSLLVRSGALTQAPELTSITGVRVEVPFFRAIDPVEERMTSGNNWGTSGAGYFTPQKIAASTQFATITHRGFAYAADKLSRLAIGQDPLEVFGIQLADALNKRKALKFISHLEGLLGTGGPLNSTNSLNKSVTSNSTDANYLTAANVVQARYLLSERQDAITTMYIHSSVQAYLEQIGFLTYDADRAGVNTRLLIGSAYNLRVVVDDQVPIIGTTGQQRQFVCYLVGDGVAMEGDQTPTEIDTGYNPLSKQSALVVDYHHGLHIPGTSWSANFDNPTNAQLATGSNFALAYANPKLIPAVRLIVNSPFGGVI